MLDRALSSREMRSRVFLQNRETKEFLASNQQWVKARAKARDFQTLSEAKAFAQGSGFKAVDVLFEVDGGDAIIPV